MMYPTVRPNTSITRLLAVVAALTICPACSNGRFPVQGEVTFNGKAVDEGTICFEPADGNGPTSGGKIRAGKYAIIGDAACLPGKKVVRVFAVRKTGRKVADQFRPQNRIDQIEPYIPDVYNGQSTLTYVVADTGPNVADFHLKTQ